LSLVGRHQQHLLLIADVDRERDVHVREDDGVFQWDEQESFHDCSLPRWLRLSNMSICDYYTDMSNDASEAWTLLFRLFVSQRGRVPQVAAEFELSPMQAHVLRLLEPGEPLPMRTLARKLCCDASNVTGIVDRLEERGLVQPTPPPPDP